MEEEFMLNNNYINNNNNNNNNNKKSNIGTEPIGAIISAQLSQPESIERSRAKRSISIESIGRIVWNPIQSNPIQSNPIQSNPIQWDRIKPS